MDRVDQSRTHMRAAIDFIKQNVKPNELIFTDYQTDLILGHYLCQQQPISFEAAPATFEQFSCGGYGVVSQDYKGWQFWASNFPQEWQRLVHDYKLSPGETVWVVQAGWGVALPQDLQRHFAEFHDLHFESFGKNILIFKLTVGQPMPSVAK
jgi:hypothetical protein